MEMKEMEIEMVKIPEDSLVAVSFPNLDLHDVKIVMKQLIKAGEASGIYDFSILTSSGYKELNVPANLLAAAVDKNHTPINNEANFTGANLLTIDNPIGEINNSPVV